MLLYYYVMALFPLLGRVIRVHMDSQVKKIIIMWNDQILQYDSVFGSFKRDLEQKILYKDDCLDHVLYLIRTRFSSTCTPYNRTETFSCETLGTGKNPPVLSHLKNAFRSVKPMG